ncbi:MAG: BPTI/Kunitz domain-containing protein [Chromatiaceae bacterium]
MRWTAVTGLLLASCLQTGCSGGDTKEWLPVRCLERPDSGPCTDLVYRYYYDYASDRCRAFAYGGCEGHAPFESREACVSACEAGGGGTARP